MSSSIPSDSDKPVQPAVNTWGFESLTQRLYEYVDSLSSSKRKTLGFVWVGVAAVFIVVASLPLPSFLFWVTPIIGVPSGIILFALLLSLLRVTRLRELQVVNLREWATPRRRVTFVIVGVILFAALLLLLSQWGVPQGVGGALTIVAALSGYNIIRRTPYEIELAAKGIPDPREYIADEFEDEEDEEDSSDYIDDEDNEPRRFR